MKKVKQQFKSWREEVTRHRTVYCMLFLILAGGFFVRVYRLGDLLGFYYDQGRDALVIWDLIYKSKTFLIGSTTGIEGIFLGPLYYYVIAPFYWVSGGDPVGPAVFLGVLTTAAAAVLFYLGKRYFSYGAGLVAAFIFSFSYYVVIASRWLSNPTPLLLVSCFVLLGLGKVLEGKAWGWVLAVGAAGAGLQFEAASATFFLPVLMVFALWQGRKIGWKMWIFSLAVFGLLLSPQIIFNFRHGGILVMAFKKFLLGEKSFRPEGLGSLIGKRMDFYYQVFGVKILPGYLHLVKWFLVAGGVGLVWAKGKEKFWLVCVVTLFAPLVSLLFYQGNHGYVWDYYFTGVYGVFILLLAVGIVSFARWWWGYLIILVFLCFFAFDNGRMLKNYLIAGVDGPEHITLGNMKQAVDWIFTDAKGRRFNVDTYVPPVIPYSYDYLYLWMGTSKYGKVPEGAAEKLLYTLYEVDPPHPERLEVWMERQKGIGKIEEEVRFGGIGVQRRERL